MKRIIIFTALALLAAACELIVIGKPDKPAGPKYTIDRTNPTGTVLLFKTELDSNNIPAAARILADSTGRRYLAYEMYEMYDELMRVRRLIGNDKINKIQSDSITPVQYNIRLQFADEKSMYFYTSRFGEYWYIVGYE